MNNSSNEVGTSIEIFKSYPLAEFNPLIPVKVMSRVSPLHKLSVNVVEISTDEADKDIYKEKNGDFALTKKALMKLMAAANIQVVESKSVTPSSCQRCLEMARATGKPMNCGACDCRNDIAWQVTIAIPDTSGGFRRVTATREFVCADEKAKAATVKQFDQAFAFRAAHTESKALNRAIREALMIKSTYRLEDLKKPFAVPVISPNFDDPQLKSAMIERYAQGDNLLFGDAAPAAKQLANSLPADTVIPPDEPEIPEDVLDLGDDGAFPAEVEPAAFECRECGDVLKAFEDPASGRVWTPEQTAEFAQKQFSTILCRKCLTARIKTAQTARKAG